MHEQKKSFLLSVDPEWVSRFRTSMVLQQLGYHVFSVQSAEDARLIIQLNAPKIILTDIILPGMNGVDFLKEIKNNQNTRSIPVLICTGVRDPAYRRICTAAGCAGYLLQPADPSFLFQEIQKATEMTPRQYIRLSTFLDVIIGAGGIPGHRVTKEKVTALSENGMYVSTVNPLQFGTVLPFTLFLQRDQAAGIDFEGKVIYSHDGKNGDGKQPGMGVIFTTIRQQDKEQIKNFILERLSRTV